jgi:hypothetical protein
MSSHCLRVLRPIKVKIRVLIQSENWNQSNHPRLGSFWRYYPKLPDNEINSQNN